MNLNKSANWLSRGLLLFFFFGITSCNPYTQTIRINKHEDNIHFLLSELEKNYAFSAHKSIEWHEFEPIFAKNLSEPFSSQKYLSLRNLIYTIPDARLNIRSSRDEKLMNEELDGYTGFDISRILDGSCRVIKIDSSSQAFEKGLRPGDRILAWNGSPIKEILNNKQLHWGIKPANLEFKEVLQDHFLMRGPAGSEIELFFESSSGNNKGIRITFKSSKPSFVPEILKIPKKGNTNSNFLKLGNYGIWSLPEFSPGIRAEFLSKILPQLNMIKGLVIDLRNNQGGHDAIAAELAGYFIKDEVLYEETLIKDMDTGDWQEIGHITAFPSKSHTFQFPIIILISPLCNGAGEGFANVLWKEDNIQTMGMFGTAGSFSYPGGVIKIPGKFDILYPIGMSLDENGIILLESPGIYGGGLYPDIRIPKSAGNLIRLASGEDILIDEAIHHLGR